MKSEIDIALHPVHRQLLCKDLRRYIKSINTKNLKVGLHLLFAFPA
jgi:hypothetical protein